VLGHLPNSLDAQLSAKAALFVGRRVDSPAWIEKQLSREDPRLRANALEGTWGKKVRRLCRILEDCLYDENNRVAGNALIGLHLAGAPDIADKALDMSESEDPALRATAAWAMGRIGDPVFIPRLTEFMKDGAQEVRRTAIRALVEIGRIETRKAAAKAAQPEPPVAQPEAAPVEPEAPRAPNRPSSCAWTDRALPRGADAD